MKIKNLFSSATKKLVDKEAEKALYLMVAEDIDSNIIDKGMWTKAFAQAEGNEARQKAIYIDLMVDFYKAEILAGEQLANILAKEEAAKRRRKENEERARREADPDIKAKAAKQEYEEKYLKKWKKKEEAMRNSLQPQTQKKQTLEEIYPPKNPTPGNPLIFIATALIFLIFSALAL